MEARQKKVDNHINVSITWIQMGLMVQQRIGLSDDVLLHSSLGDWKDQDV